ncbi:52 kDa repressor of the inhibitor of the protein kinase-like [Diadema antillarum]|uniref:52 kDa repressor of the inhibitor of the protein kinase-like n=1 Tax=Diadema antillarum TaxID=105358 RepID=UPI003A89ED70
MDACGQDFSGTSWSPKSKADASSLLNSLTSFEFIVTFNVVYTFLSHLAGLTVKLQGRTMDIIKANVEVSEVRSTYAALTQSMDEEFAHTYGQATKMAADVNVEPSMPRTVGRQSMRSNAPASSPEEHFRRNVAVPFLAHINNELESQFSPLSVVSSRILGLIPSVLCDDDSPSHSLDEVIDTYAEDMPSAEVFPQELFRWKHKYQTKPPNERPSTAAETIKQCDADMFPNVFTLLKICCTIPTTSCECERSASALRRLHTYLRASMTQDRLSALALMHIHYNFDVDNERVVKLFARKHPSRLELQTMLKD